MVIQKICATVCEFACLHVSACALKLDRRLSVAHAEVCKLLLSNQNGVALVPAITKLNPFIISSIGTPAVHRLHTSPP